MQSGVTAATKVKQGCVPREREGVILTKVQAGQRGSESAGPWRRRALTAEKGFKGAQGEGKGAGLEGECLRQCNSIPQTGWLTEYRHLLLTALEARKSELGGPAWPGVTVRSHWKGSRAR